MHVNWMPYSLINSLDLDLDDACQEADVQGQTTDML